MVEYPMIDRQIGGAKDLIDDKLISLLRQNARLTMTALSQALSLSRTAVQARMVRLEREQVIVGYRAVLGERRDVDNGLSAMLSITFSQRPCSSVVEVFRHWSEIANYYSVTGPVDGYMLVRVNSALELSQLVDRLSALEGVASVQSAVVLKANFG